MRSYQQPKWLLALLIGVIALAGVEAASFRSSKFTVFVLENATVGASVGTYTLDNTNGDIYTFAFSSTPPCPLQVATTTPQVSLAQTLDRETLADYECELVATSGSNTASTRIFVKVSDVNDNAPVFNQSSYTWQISENTDTPTFTAIAATDIDQVIITIDPATTQESYEVANGVVRYALVNGTDVFAIDEETAEITMLQPLDREAFPVFVLMVEAHDLGSPRQSVTRPLTITVTDVNDNAPEFSESAYSLNVSELVTANTALLTMGASDADAGNNAAITFSISSLARVGANSAIQPLALASEWPFTVDPSSGMLSVSENASIASAAVFDYDSGVHGYVLQVTATDAGASPLSSSVPVYVTLVDVNDNTPSFAQSTYELSVPENTEGNLLQLTATDADAGELTARIAYRLLHVYRGTEVNASADVVGSAACPFAVVAESGLLRTSNTSILDREDEANYILVVEASNDEVSPMLSNTTTVLLTLDDVNDNAPELETPPPVSWNVREDATDIELLSQMVVLDQDSGVNARVDIGFVGNSSDETLFRIDDGTDLVSLGASNATLVAVGPFDYEAATVHRVWLHVVDQGSPVLDRVYALEVWVSDVNDNAPSFDTGSQEVEVTLGEDAVIGTPVAVLAASDVDTVSASQLQFAIEFVMVADASALQGNGLGPVELNASSASQWPFMINATTGAMVTTQPLDYEAATSYNVSILVYDNCTSQLDALADAGAHEAACTAGFSSRAWVRVAVTDVNEHAPEFVGSVPSPSLAEDATTGTVVTTVAATDGDGSLEYGTVVYSVGLGMSTLFAVDETTGEVTLIGMLDAETSTVEALEVVACDTAVDVTEQRCTSRYINVSVTDVNDNPPLLVGNATQTISISEATFVGTSLLHLNVTDADVTSSFRDVAFHTNSSVIDLNGSTIVLAQVLDREVLDEVVAFVSVSNVAALSASTPPYLAVFRLTILVQDVNDNAPIFYAPSNVSLPENAKVGRRVALLNATDTDLESELIFTSQSGTPFVVSSNGTVSLDSSLDFEAQQSWSLNITVSDGAFSQSQTLFVLVEDINDNAPEPSWSTGNVSVFENNASFPLPSCSATDADAGVNGLVSYSVNSNPYFSINTVTGELTLLQPFDFETVQSFELICNASDQGEPILWHATSIFFTIVDQNDNSPVCNTSSPYSVSENVPANTTFATVLPYDLDTVHSSTFEFEQCSMNTWVGITDDGQLFAKEQVKMVQNERTGLMEEVRYFLDRETTPELSFCFWVRDASSTPLSTMCNVTINVLDVNDETPSFTNASFAFSIVEEQVNATIVLPPATDADAGNNSVLTYSLLGALAPSFTLDNGTLVATTPLDRETHDSFELVLKACDHGTVPRCGNTTLLITVTDINDDIPTFASQVYDIALNDNMVVGTQVAHVSATDADAGLNGEFEFRVADNPFLAVNASTGAIVLVALPANNSEFRFGVSVLDHGTPSLHSNATLVVRLTRFTELEIVLTVSEVAANQSAVLNVSHLLLTPDVVYDFRLSGSSDFVLDDRLLLVNAELDFRAKSSYNMTLAIWELGSQVDYLAVYVDLSNVNEAPVFSDGNREVFVEEDTSADIPLTIIHVTDQDRGVDGKVDFSLSGADVAYFYLQAINDTSAFLFANASFDRETRGSYSLEVEARDQALTPLADHQTISVTVTDLNDNAPVFNQSEYSASVPENVAGNVLVQISVTDADQVVTEFDAETQTTNVLIGNGLVTLMVVQGPCNVTASGVVALIEKLDYEVAPVQTCVIRATDQGVPSKSSEANVTITVTDVNDNAPEFSESAYSLNVSELVTANTALLTMGASDADAGNNAAITFSISSLARVGANSAIQPLALASEWPFTVDPSSGMLSVSENASIASAAVFDYDSGVHGYVLQVTATDAGASPLSSSVPVYVTLVDVNDNTPSFAQSTYELSVPENTEGNLLQLTATDADAGELTARIAYRLLHVYRGTEVNASADVVGSAACPFAVVAESGLLRTSNTSILDREDEANYILVVEASNDEVSPMLSNTTTVLLTLDDVNDNAPELETPPPVSWNVREDATDIELLSQMVVLDQDSGVNARVDIGFVGNSSDETLFRIDDGTDLVSLGASNATLVAVGPFDYEAATVHRVWLHVVDQGSPVLDRVYALEVWVSDVNDNAPSFDTGSQEVEVTLGEDAVIGTPVAVLAASDVDTVSASQLQFAIEFVMVADASALQGNGLGPVELNASSASQWPFMINATTGAMVTTQPLDYEAATSYNVSILVYDNCTSQLDALADAGAHEAACTAGFSSRAWVRVAVTDVNEHAPEFVGSVPSPSLAEDATTGTVVTTVAATDGDGSLEYGTVVYSVGLGMSTLFAVDETTGEVTLIGMLDAETSTVEALEVVACDTAVDVTEQRCTSRYINVSVTDVNDNPPELSLSASAFVVNENQLVPKLLSAVTFSDADVGFDASNVWINISSGSACHINNSGLWLVESLDYETATATHCTLQYGNVAQPFFVQFMDILVNVTNLNDNAPQFMLSPSSVAVAENATVNTLLSGFNFSDADGDMVSVQVISGSDICSVSTQTQEGTIRLAAPLDRETLDQHICVIEFTDGVYAGTETLLLNVTDINDNRPQFDNETLLWAVKEETSSEVLTLQIFDADLNSNVTVSCVAGPACSAVTVASEPWQLTLKESLDFEALNETTLFGLLVASDGVWQTNASLEITVQDVNDNAPLFEALQFNVTIPENQAVGSALLEVQVTDADSFPYNTSTLEVVSHDVPFAVAPNGTFYLARAVDYEVQDSYTVLLRATDDLNATLTSGTEIYVVLTDINDNAPSVALSLDDLYIFENISVDTRVGHISIVDADSHAVNHNNLALSDSCGAFALNGTEVIVQAPLDHEQYQSCNITATVTDATFEAAFSASDEAQLWVINVNDFVPVFVDNTTVNLTVPENQTVNSSLLLVPVYDGDASPYNEVDITILNNADGKFAIQNQTLVLVQPLDYESGDREYPLLLKATDMQSLLFALKVVNVVVLDVNDNPPIITGPDALSVAENTMGQALAEYHIASGDSVDSLAVSVEADIRGLFSISFSGSGWSLALEQILDFENQTSHPVTIHTCDGLFCTNLSIVIAVEDVNDKFPMVTSNTTLSVSEHATTGLLVTLSYADEDGSWPMQNSTFSLLDIGVPFVLQSDGSLWLTGALDRETTASYALTGRVANVDHSAMFYTDFPLVINVADVNDNAPVCVGVPTFFSLSEALPQRSLIAQLSCSDADVGANGQLTYRFEEAISPLAVSATGALTTTAFLDHEIAPTFEVKLWVVDGGTPALSYSANIRINVTNVNDNPPVLAASLFNARILENNLPGQTVLNLSATDRDGDSLVFNVLNSELFQVTETGTISAMESLDRELEDSYSLQVTVFDGLYTAAATVIVVVDDENDNAPRILHTEVFISPAGALAAFMYPMHYSDADANDNISVSFLDELGIWTLSDEGVLFLSSWASPLLIAKDNITLVVEDGVHTTSENLSVLLSAHVWVVLCRGSNFSALNSTSVQYGFAASDTAFDFNFTVLAIPWLQDSNLTAFLAQEPMASSLDPAAVLQARRLDNVTAALWHDASLLGQLFTPLPTSKPMYIPTAALNMSAVVTDYSFCGFCNRSSPWRDPKDVLESDESLTVVALVMPAELARKLIYSQRCNTGFVEVLDHPIFLAEADDQECGWSNNDGDSVGALVARGARDINVEDELGMAIAVMPNVSKFGVWQYQVAESACWYNVPPVTLATFFLLPAAARLRFAPKPFATWTEDMTLIAHAWDMQCGGNTTAAVESSSVVMCISADPLTVRAVPRAPVTGAELAVGCDAQPFSSTTADGCGVCNGGNKALDCAGTCFGAAFVNDCSLCVVPENSTAGQDCHGTCNGTAVLDACGACAGGTTGLEMNADQDCAGTCFGAMYIDECGLCVSPGSPSYLDCAGVCFGDHVLDECGNCSAPGIPAPARDACGVCHGHNETCLGCDGLLTGAMPDNCNQCGGSNNTCSKLVRLNPTFASMNGRTAISVEGAGFVAGATQCIIETIVNQRVVQRLVAMTVTNAGFGVCTSPVYAYAQTFALYVAVNGGQRYGGLALSVYNASRVTMATSTSLYRIYDAAPVVLTATNLPLATNGACFHKDQRVGDLEVVNSSYARCHLDDSVPPGVGLLSVSPTGRLGDALAIHANFRVESAAPICVRATLDVQRRTLRLEFDRAVVLLGDCSAALVEAQGSLTIVACLNGGVAAPSTSSLLFNVKMKGSSVAARLFLRPGAVADRGSLASRTAFGFVPLQVITSSITYTLSGPSELGACSTPANFRVHTTAVGCVTKWDVSSPHLDRATAAQLQRSLRLTTGDELNVQALGLSAGSYMVLASCRAYGQVLQANQTLVVATSALPQFHVQLVSRPQEHLILARVVRTGRCGNAIRVAGRTSWQVVQCTDPACARVAHSPPVITALAADELAIDTEELLIGTFQILAQLEETAYGETTTATATFVKKAPAPPVCPEVHLQAPLDGTLTSSLCLSRNTTANWFCQDAAGRPCIDQQNNQILTKGTSSFALTKLGTAGSYTFLVRAGAAEASCACHVEVGPAYTEPQLQWQLPSVLCVTGGTIWVQARGLSGELWATCEDEDGLGCSVDPQLAGITAQDQTAWLLAVHGINASAARLSITLSFQNALHETQSLQFQVPVRTPWSALSLTPMGTAASGVVNEYDEFCTRLSGVGEANSFVVAWYLNGNVLVAIRDTAADLCLLAPPALTSVSARLTDTVSGATAEVKLSLQTRPLSVAKRAAFARALQDNATAALAAQDSAMVRQAMTALVLEADDETDAAKTTALEAVLLPFLDFVRRGWRSDWIDLARLTVLRALDRGVVSKRDIGSLLSGVLEPVRTTRSVMTSYAPLSTLAAAALLEALVPLYEDGQDDGILPMLHFYGPTSELSTVAGPELILELVPVPSTLPWTVPLPSNTTDAPWSTAINVTINATSPSVVCDGSSCNVQRLALSRSTSASFAPAGYVLMTHAVGLSCEADVAAMVDFNAWGMPGDQVCASQSGALSAPSGINAAQCRLVCQAGDFVRVALAVPMVATTAASTSTVGGSTGEASSSSTLTPTSSTESTSTQLPSSVTATSTAAGSPSTTSAQEAASFRNPELASSRSLGANHEGVRILIGVGVCLAVVGLLVLLIRNRGKPLAPEGTNFSIELVDGGKPRQLGSLFLPEGSTMFDARRNLLSFLLQTTQEIPLFVFLTADGNMLQTSDEGSLLAQDLYPTGPMYIQQVGASNQNSSSIASPPPLAHNMSLYDSSSEESGSDDEGPGRWSQAVPRQLATSTA
ncbi:uncharacterized protein MONBRDRAFT_37884 [Monosiga brevicollis MX1]|uniref:Cadherin domain-containing protein n=1 Tax=Monosiga brevicollis TaxID=81824 RepID=A9V4E5_MONBE|nr:uncharacterized protein MONBRDRAFT_37884 [Monosiga brevicollis MX1]EDQ87601.1 predicted protein [Monosiga brevicollis MX1]|eukprot:XP_001747521.1 hypothetical protein [Monosiga brevicollis MX1]